MRDTLTIRRAGEADLPACADFWMAMFEEVGNFSERDFDRNWRRRFVTYFARRIAADQAMYALAFDGGALAATAGALLADGYPCDIHGVRFGYIFGVRVKQEYRGRGIATALTRETMTFLKKKDCVRIRLHASPAGRPMYEKVGFVPSNEMILG